MGNPAVERVRELEERYIKPLPQIVQEVATYETKVREHLIKPGTDRAVAVDWAEMMQSNRMVEDQLTGDRDEADLGWVNDIVNKLNEHEGWNRNKPIRLRKQEQPPIQRKAYPLALEMKFKTLAEF